MAQSCGNYSSIFSFQSKKNVQTKSHANEERRENHPFEPFLCRSAVYGPIAESNGFICTSFNEARFRPKLRDSPID